MATHQFVPETFVGFLLYNVLQHFRLLVSIDVELRRAVVLPPIVVVVLTQVEGDAEHVGQREVVVEITVDVANVLVQFLGVVALYFVIASDVNARDFPSRYFVRQKIGKLSVVFAVYHGIHIAQHHQKVHVFYALCRGDCAFFRTVNVRHGVVHQSVLGVDGSETVILRDYLPLVSAKRSSVNHFLGVHSVTFGVVQFFLRYHHFVNQIVGFHATCIQIVVIFALYFHPSDAVCRSGKHNLIVVLNGVHHRTVGETVYLHVEAYQNAAKQQTSKANAFQRNAFFAVTDRREKQQQRKHYQGNSHKQRRKKFWQNKLQVICRSQRNHHHNQHRKHAAYAQRNYRGQFAFPNKQADGGKNKRQPQEYAHQKRRFHYKKSGIFVCTQRLGYSAPINSQRKPKQRHHKAVGTCNNSQQVLFEKFKHFHYLPKQIYRTKNSMSIRSLQEKICRTACPKVNFAKRHFSAKALGKVAFS